MRIEKVKLRRWVRALDKAGFLTVLAEFNENGAVLLHKNNIAHVRIVLTSVPQQRGTYAVPLEQLKRAARGKGETDIRLILTEENSIQEDDLPSENFPPISDKAVRLSVDNILAVADARGFSDTALHLGYVALEPERVWASDGHRAEKRYHAPIPELEKVNQEVVAVSEDAIAIIAALRADELLFDPDTFTFRISDGEATFIVNANRVLMPEIDRVWPKREPHAIADRASLIDALESLSSEDQVLLYGSDGNLMLSGTDNVTAVPVKGITNEPVAIAFNRGLLLSVLMNRKRDDLLLSFPAWSDRTGHAGPIIIDDEALTMPLDKRWSSDFSRIKELYHTQSRMDRPLVLEKPKPKKNARRKKKRNFKSDFQRGESWSRRVTRSLKEELALRRLAERWIDVAKKKESVFYLSAALRVLRKEA